MSKLGKRNRINNSVLKGGRFIMAFCGTFILAFMVASVLAPVDNSSAADSSSGSLSMSYSAEQNITISLDKTDVGITASSTDFGKLLTDNFNVTVSTNNSTGYVLNMAVDSSATNGATITSGGSTQENVATNSLVNTEDNRYYLPSISASITNPTDSTFPVNSWAYSISNPSVTPTNMVYSPLPAAGSSEEIKKVTSLTLEEDSNGNLTADDVTPVTVAAKADMSIPAGTYTNKLIFTAVTNYNVDYDGYTIIYNPNNGEGDMSMVSHIGVQLDDSIMLYAPNYWRTGYGFLGWSTNKDAAIASYGPNETITLSSSDIATATPDGAITMYAIWKASEGNMQGWTGCSSMSVGDVTALTDTRDGDTYAVAKLTDGNCWTLENSRLSSGTIDSTTTNNPISGFTWVPSSDNWCASDTATCDDKVLLNTNNINHDLAASPSTNTNSNSWYSYGTMYNWYTATAGRGTYSKSSGNTTGDICPVGWHLPTSNSDGEIQAMYNAIGAAPTILRKYPNNFVLSGIWLRSSSGDRLSYGLYWSSTAYDSNYAYHLRFNEGIAQPLNNYSKNRGYAIRCIANTPTASAGTIVYNSNGGSGDMSMVTHTGVSNNANVQLYAPNYWRSGYGFLGWSTDPQAESKIGTTNAATIYGPQETITAPSDIATNGIVLYAIWKKSEGNMQDWKGCSSMSIGDVTALTDTRDGDTYAIAKLADGKCWSTENLRLASGAINSSTTHNPIANFAWTESSNSWCADNNAACINKVALNTNNINSSLDASPSANVSISSSWYSYGVNYNWYAATAGNGTYEKTSGNASGDICPLGWHLPTGNSGGEFQAMYTAIGGTPANIRKHPNNFVFSGYWDNLMSGGRGSTSYYWSSTANDKRDAFLLHFISSSVSPAVVSQKHNGFSVRCIAG